MERKVISTFLTEEELPNSRRPYLKRPKRWARVFRSHSRFVRVLLERRISSHTDQQDGSLVKVHEAFLKYRSGWPAGDIKSTQHKSLDT